MGTYSRTGRHSCVDAEQAFVAEHGCLPVPRLVQWMATLRCPLGCPHCLAAYDGPPCDDMPLGNALDLIDQAADMGVEEFLVTGGEPLVRADLPAVIEHLARRGLSWSLNTACLPSAETRRAILRNPPSLAAVSLDGPAAVHDAFRRRDGTFREAVESIAFFARLGGVQVVAGTTVTSFNIAHLAETFHIVARSGAAAWGIHLLVPEGRARRRRDLFLSRRQLDRLMRFVAAKRRYFPVTMADEFGYCGDWEPLLRDQPFRCGAGVAQCVVLPDGEVMPCTTMDRSASAGSLRRQSLATIWREGFGELRRWKPEGRCAECQYAPACSGGCWLMRRGGMRCYREVWQVPAALRTAAGVAVCLGVLGAGAAGQSATPAAGGAEEPSRPAETVPAARERPVEHAVSESEATMVRAEVAPGIERRILQWYASHVSEYGRCRPPAGTAAVAKELPALTAEQAADPGYAFFERMREGKLPETMEDLVRDIDKATKTAERSMAFGAVLWRAAQEWCLRNPEPAKRAPEARAALRQVLTGVEKATEAWRREIFDRRLEPYLARGRKPIRYRFEMSKAIIRPLAWLELSRDTAAERWGVAKPPGAAPARLEPDEALEGWLDRHPLAESTRVKVTAKGTSGLARLNTAGHQAVREGDSVTVGIFDLLAMPDGMDGATVEVESLASKRLTVRLPAGAELSYIDLLMLTHEQHAEELDRQALDAVRRREGFNPLLFGAMLKLRAAREAEMAGRAATDDARVRSTLSDLHAADLWLADFWMF